MVAQKVDKSRRPRGRRGDARSPRTGGKGGGPAPSPALIGYAALLCVHDAEPDAAIARRLGVSRRTLARWKRRPEFAAARAAATIATYEARGELALGLYWAGLGPMPVWRDGQWRAR